MNRNLFLLISLLCLALTGSSLGQTRIDPGVPGFGAIYDLPEGAYLPDAGHKYQIVVDVMIGAEDPSEINPGLWNLARLVNLHVAAGIPADSLEVVAVFHASATPVVLTSEAYEAALGVPNPNLDIFAALQQAGMRFFVCGQSLTFRGYAFDTVNEYVRPSYSAMTVLTEHQLLGFALLTFR